MKNYIPILVLVIGAIIATIALPARSQFEQPPGGGSQKVNLRKSLTKHSALPLVAQYNEPGPQDPQDQVRRQSRNNLSKGLYSGKLILDPGTPEVNGQTETVDLTFIDTVKILKPGERKDPDGLPISGTMIVIGTVTTGKAYINQGHDGVFSEYKVTVSDVLKPDPDSRTVAGDEITTWQPGGSLQFHSGYIKHVVIAGRGFPEVGTQYVLFLRSTDKNAKDYAISTAFSIKDQLVSPLNDAQDQAAFDGMRLQDFLTKLRQEISVRQEGGLNQ